MRKTTIVLMSLLLMLLAGCGGASDEKTVKDKDTSAGSSTGGTKAGDEPPKPAPIMLGTQRYTSPCRLLAPDDVESIYGDPGSYANFNQIIVEKSLSLPQMREESKKASGGVRTQCLYSLDNKAQTSVRVTVMQFISPQAALRSWKRIKRLGTGLESKQLEREGRPELQWLIDLAKENEANSGGDPVKGLDPSILFVVGRTEFTGVRRNLVITVAREDYAGQAFEGKEIKGTLNTTREVFSRIYANADNTELDQSPAPSYWEQQNGWPQFLDVCKIFDDEAMVATTGHPSILVEDVSILRDPNHRLTRNNTPGSKAVHNECRRMAGIRTGTLKSQYWHGDLEIAYAAPGDSGPELLEGYVLRRLFDDEKSRKKYHLSDLVKAGALTKTEVKGTDAAYVFAYKERGQRYGWIVADVGPHVFRLDLTRTQNRYDQVPMATAKLVAGAEMVAENIKKATAD